MNKLPVVLILALLFMAGCKNDSDSISIDNYEKGKTTVAEIEEKSPERFLAVSGNNKKNLVGQTVIKGVIINNAKVKSFKDVRIKLSFYSKTGALLEEDQEVIYETIEPGASKSFKSKYFAAKGTDSVAMKILTAVPLK